MRLSLQTQHIDHVAVIRCQGRIVSGAEITALQKEIDDAGHAKKRIVLHLADVTFIDSAGLGLLVRMFSRLRNAGGGLKLCELSPVVLKALRITNLHAVMPAYASERQAVEAFGQWQPWDPQSPPPITTVVCVDDSFNVLAYLNALLTQAGYEVFPTRHFNDARILVSAIRPGVFVLGPGGQATESMVESIRKSVPHMHVLLLPPDFSTEDASQSGADLIARVRSVS
jgi:anti-sigma B factor antagonist